PPPAPCRVSCSCEAQRVVSFRYSGRDRSWERLRDSRTHGSLLARAVCSRPLAEVNTVQSGSIPGRPLLPGRMPLGVAGGDPGHGVVAKCREPSKVATAFKCCCEAAITLMRLVPAEIALASR